MGTIEKLLVVFVVLLLPKAIFSECNNETQYDCKIGTKRRCIPLEWQCDNVLDCENGMDEVGCVYLHRCESGVLMCRTGGCISKSFKCDGEADCPGGHDEHGCAGMDLSHLRGSEHSRAIDTSFDWQNECKSPKYQCNSGHQCIVESAVCDGIHDCPDGDDERNCTTKKGHCHINNRMCADGSGCIPIFWLCDGESDCDDGSDENDCDHLREPHAILEVQSNDVLCSQTEFRCDGSVGLCIPLNKTCDGTSDCPLGDDEGDRCKACSSLDCQYKCHITDEGGRCYCPDGSKLDYNERSCFDIDECESREAKQCQHFCENRDNKYECSCAHGYSLGRDGHSCHIDKNREGTLFISLGTEVRSMPLFDAILSDEVYSVSQTIDSSLARSIDFHDNKLYLAERNQHDGSIATSLNGNLVFLRQKLVGVSHIAVDWIGGNLYFTQTYPAARPGISICTLNGFYCRLIVEGNIHTEKDISSRQYYRGLALNPQKGIMAWIEACGGKHRIMGANMDGSNLQVLADNKLEEPSGLTFDHIRNELYFGDIGKEMIEKINMKTMERHIVLTHGVHNPFDLAFFDGLLYWSDWGTESLKVAELSWHHSSSHVIHTFRRLPYGLAINHTAYQPHPYHDPCDAIRDSCKWMCVVVPGRAGHLSSICVCPDNYMYSEMEKTCVPQERRSAFVEEHHIGIELMQDMCKHGSACDNEGTCVETLDGDHVIRISCSCPAPFTGERCEIGDPTASAFVEEGRSSDSWISLACLFILVLLIAAFIFLYKNEKFLKATKHLLSSLSTQFADSQLWIRSRLPSEFPTNSVQSQRQVENPLFIGTSSSEDSVSVHSSAFRNPLYNEMDPSLDSFESYQVTYSKGSP